VIVRLTNRQRARVAELFGAVDDPRLVFLDRWWDYDWSVASKHRVDTVMPAAAWRMVEAILFDHCFNERGFRARDRARSTDLNALKAIRRTLNVREGHPALSKRGAIGQIAELIPAWRFPSPDASDKAYSPHPVPTMPYVVLAPETRTVSGNTTTLWVEADRSRLPGYLILDEEQHFLFA